jgi:hypothetical protein
MKDPDAKKNQWQQFRLQASGGFVGLPNRLVDSKAFAAMTTGASVHTLVWFWQKAVYGKRGKKQGIKSPIGRTDMIKNNGELSFTYKEAEWRGMNARRFSRALKDLFRLGFIDIARQGRGVQGEYTKYAISTRWQRYDTIDWQEIPFPENFHEGFRSDAYRKKSKKKIADENIRYSTDENVRCGADKQPHNGRKRPLKTHISPNPQRTISSVSIDLAMPSGTEKSVRENVRPLYSRSKSIAAAIRRDNDSFYRIATDPKALENLAAALSAVIGHLPDNAVMKKKIGQPRRNLDPNMALMLDHAYDPTCSPWAEDEPMTLAGGGIGATH